MYRLLVYHFTSDEEILYFYSH